MPRRRRIRPQQLLSHRRPRLRPPSHPAPRSRSRRRPQRTPKRSRRSSQLRPSTSASLYLHQLLRSRLLRWRLQRRRHPLSSQRPFEDDRCGRAVQKGQVGAQQLQRGEKHSRARRAHRARRVWATRLGYT